MARAYDAQCTPDFFGSTAQDELQYRGRLSAWRIQPTPNARRELFEGNEAGGGDRRWPARLPSMGPSGSTELSAIRNALATKAGCRITSPLSTTLVVAAATARSVSTTMTRPSAAQSGLPGRRGTPCEADSATWLGLGKAKQLDAFVAHLGVGATSGRSVTP